MDWQDTYYEGVHYTEFDGEYYFLVNGEDWVHECYMDIIYEDEDE